MKTALLWSVSAAIGFMLTLGFAAFAEWVSALLSLWGSAVSIIASIQAGRMCPRYRDDICGGDAS